MRGWLPWLLVFGVIAGLCGRVLALDHFHGKQEAHQCCGHDHHDHDHGGDDDGSGGGDHGPDCPPWPHDHNTHACCHPAPLAGADIRVPGLVPPGGSWMEMTWHRALRPEEPVFALDKPPLI